MSEILDRADEWRAIAERCETIQEFWKATGWRDIQSAHRANKLLGLGLDIVRQSGRDGARRVAQPCPKPTAKGAKT